MRYLLVFLFAWVVVGSVAVWPFQLDLSHKNNQDYTQQPDHNTKPSVSSTLKGSEPNKPQKPSENKTDQSDPKSVRITEIPPPNTWYKAYVYSTIVMAVITIVLAVIGFFGVRYARRTLRAVESQGSIMQGQLAIMQEETTAVIKSAEAAKRSADAFINADRAWLHAEVITDTPERKLVPTSTQYPVAVTNYGRTVGEITGYRVSGGRLDRIDELLSDRGQMISLGNNGRRFLAPGRSENVFPFDIKQVFEYCGLWEDIGRSRVTGVIVIEIRYCDVLDRKAQHLSRFVYSYDSDVIKLSLLPEYTEYT